MRRCKGLQRERALFFYYSLSLSVALSLFTPLSLCLLAAQLALASVFCWLSTLSVVKRVQVLELLESVFAAAAAAVVAAVLVVVVTSVVVVVVVAVVACCCPLLPAAATLCVLHVVALPKPSLPPSSCYCSCSSCEAAAANVPRTRVSAAPRLSHSATATATACACACPCECVASSLLSMCIQYYYDVPLALASSVCVREC